MLIKQTRIRSMDRHFSYIGEGTRIILGVIELERFGELLSHIGFNEPLSLGDTVLPSADFGPISRFNAEGKYIIHNDRPMETAYRMVEWHWEEWRGRYETEEVFDYVDVPYKRYPRTFIEPPSIELSIASDQNGNLICVTQPVEFIPENHEVIIHIVNLYLEIFAECEILSENLEAITLPRARRLNWEILPPGLYPWNRLEQHVRGIIDNAKEGNRPVIRNRFETINSYGPEFHAIGKAGFRGYVVFGFPDKNLFVFESAYTGNATYIFGENWEELSKLTKAQILDENLQEDRIIHRKGWHRNISESLT